MTLRLPEQRVDIDVSAMLLGRDSWNTEHIDDCENLVTKIQWERYMLYGEVPYEVGSSTREHIKRPMDGVGCRDEKGL